jgi:class 3 adenylate cyclase/tetratricopeptide (TPR) repeat protein
MPALPCLSGRGALGTFPARGAHLCRERPESYTLAVSACPACGEENPERARFCLACGATIEETTLAEERKVVSVLFVDLVGFTDRSDRADPEDVRATLRPYHARLKQEIERFGGTVEKFVGDAVMAVFGAPVAHEDDAERAVRAGLRILDAIAELNESNPALELAVRAAVNSGEAVVALGARPEGGESIVTGDVVNTAARLQAIAPVGGVVVGELTRRASRHVIEYDRLEPVALKGKAEPVPVWQATGIAVDVEQAAPTPFVGRDHDLALLKETYTRTLRESSLQLVTVAGEPGVGKTRLVTELRRFIEEQPKIAIWRPGRCLPYGEGITFWALGEIVKAQAGIIESDGPDDAAEKLAVTVEAVVEDASERGWFNARLAPLVGARVLDESEAAERAESSFTAWRRFLEAIAAQQPLVLVLEDLHWADVALLDFVQHLADWVSGVPLLVICTARPELYERRPDWGGGKRNSTTISLSPLTGEETARLLSALLSRAVLPAETQAALLERAGGNPLYAEEFVRMLTDRGILDARGRLLQATDGEIEVPETVQALIAARLDTLPAERKSLLQDAAVVGKVFWAGAIAAIGEREEGVVREGLHELVRKELVRPARSSSVRDDDEFSFWHLLVRDVAYQQIPRVARAGKHEAAATWLLRITERPGDHAEILVHHYRQARELTRAAGADERKGELESQLRRFLILAGDRALELDVGKAEKYYGQALELIATGEPERASVLGKRAEAAWLAGRLPEAEREYEEAIAGFRHHGDPVRAGGAMVELVAALRDQGETSRARALLAEAVELLEREPPGEELALAYVHKARDDMLSGRAQDCLESSEKAIALSRALGLENHVARTLQFRGFARFELGDEKGIEDLRESLRISLELGLGYYTVTAYGNLADLVWTTEGPAQALELFRAAVDFGRRRGIAFKAKWVEAESLWTLYDLGGWVELLATADELIRWDERYGGSQVGVMALSYKAHVLVGQGKTAEAGSLMTDFLPRARAIEDPQVLAPALVIAARIEEARAEPVAALSLIEEFEKSTRNDARFRNINLPDALRVATRAGALDVAERLFEGARGTAARDRLAVLTGRAVLAEAHSELEDAADRFAEAAPAWGDYGHALEHGQSLLGLGRCRLALGQADANSMLIAARDVFARLGAGPLLGEADGQLGEAMAARP